MVAYVRLSKLAALNSYAKRQNNQQLYCWLLDGIYANYGNLGKQHMHSWTIVHKGRQYCMFSLTLLHHQQVLLICSTCMLHCHKAQAMKQYGSYAISMRMINWKNWIRVLKGGGEKWVINTLSHRNDIHWIYRLCHGISVTCGASKTGDAVTGVVTKFRHRTEPHTLTMVSWVQTGISTYSFHPVESNSFTQLYRIFFLQLL